MHFQRPAHNDFDKWLTELPQAELEYLIGSVNQESSDKAEERGDLAHVVALIMQFSGKPALTVEEIMRLSAPFAVCLGLEFMLRQGRVTKRGKYSFIPETSSAVFELVKEGKQEESQE